MASVVFSLANVSKHFGSVKAVDNLTLSVSEGEIVGFVGPNGAGKTTTISMLLGFLAPTHGTITIKGTPGVITPSTAAISHKSIGFVSGDMAMYDNLTGKQYLRFLGSLNGVDKAIQQKLVEQLQPTLDKKIKTLSRGNRQKIALIGGLQHNPRLLILDEPTSGLDPLMQDTFLSIITKYARAGATVFMSSHILSEVASACSRVVFMKNGAIIIDRPISDIEKESGKHVTLKSTQNSLQAAKNQLLPGAQILSSGGTSLEFLYRGETSALIRWLSTRPVKDVSIVERSLDDIFKDKYKDDKGASK